MIAEHKEPTFSSQLCSRHPSNHAHFESLAPKNISPYSVSAPSSLIASLNEKRAMDCANHRFLPGMLHSLCFIAMANRRMTLDASRCTRECAITSRHSFILSLEPWLTIDELDRKVFKSGVLKGFLQNSRFSKDIHDLPCLM